MWSPEGGSCGFLVKFLLVKSLLLCRPIAFLKPNHNTIAQLIPMARTASSNSSEYINSWLDESVKNKITDRHKKRMSEHFKLKFIKSLGSLVNEDPETMNFFLSMDYAYPGDNDTCSAPDGLGPIKVNNKIKTLAFLDNLYSELTMGGRYSPRNCKPKWKVAIIVPFRGGEQSLATFLNHMHPFLMKQNLQYGIFVVHQFVSAGEFKMNRGALMNLGFLFANQEEAEPWDCYVFHDVDLLPLDTRNLYSCSPQPRRMAVTIDSLEPMGPFEIFYNRVLMIPHNIFLDVNGFSNSYWGFVGVFDDMYMRLQKKNFKMRAFPRAISNYQMQRKVFNEIQRLEYLDREMEGFEQDGLSSLGHNIVHTVQHRPYSYALVEITTNISYNTIKNRRLGLTDVQDLYPNDFASVKTPFIQDTIGEWHHLAMAFSVTYPYNNTTICQRPHGLGPINVNSTIDLDAISSQFPEVSLGGRYSPKDCIARFKIAIIVPYRDREANLLAFLRHMHWFLIKQRVDYGLFIIEQSKSKRKFNRGKLMNVGYKVAQAARRESWDCFVFHDVDLLPLDTRNLYSCTGAPRHMSVAIDKFNFTSTNNSAFGGVSVMTGHQFKVVNGFPNKYWGWGGEDNNLYLRLIWKYYVVSQFPMSIGRYTMLKHSAQAKNSIRNDLENVARFFRFDGLSNVHYAIIKMNRHHLYTRALVDLEPP